MHVSTFIKANKMKKLFATLAAALFMIAIMVSCGKQSNVTVENFKSQAKELVNKEVTITGVASHICSHSGRKLFLASENGGEDLVTVFTSKDMKPFDKETIGKVYTVKGIVKITQTIDEQYLDNWEKDVMEQIAKGETVEEESHCGTENKAAGIEVDENAENAELAQIKAFRQKIEENNGEPLVFYHIECNNFEIK